MNICIDVYTYICMSMCVYDLEYYQAYNKPQKTLANIIFINI